jgi:glycosyltransferase involved in cell wall biosynthesis
MKIGINGRFLVAKRTGVQRAAYNLLDVLVRVDRKNEYFIFTGHDQVGRAEWNYDNVHVIPSNLRGGESVRNHFWEQFTLPKLAAKYNIDILHSPANIAPLAYKGKSIVHIHDLCFVVNPQWYSFSFRTVYNLVIPRLARRATKVITVSNNSRNDLLQFCNLDAEQVNMVYWAVDETFLAPQLPASVKQISAAEHGDYILYVGSLEPRKNIRTLVEAFEKLRDENPDLKTKLILIGGESPLFAHVRLNVKKYKDDVIYKGFIDDKTLRNFYANASLVAYPSLYEGFGFPPLEAMASGTPVVTSITSSIPEVVGDAALMVSPFDAGQLSDAMAQILRNSDLRASLIRRGYEQVKNFNWYRVARNVLAIYYSVHNDGKAGTSILPFDKWQELNALGSETCASKPIAKIRLTESRSRDEKGSD